MSWLEDFGSKRRHIIQRDHDACKQVAANDKPKEDIIGLDIVDQAKRQTFFAVSEIHPLFLEGRMIQLQSIEY